ncbi:GGDEF domain-containing protein [Salinibius halmophilus]|uniref:GGDEF domain-containing protein n=1 Tax=Salinibius halmophilus TaxID=1853216 RepID=UPI000E66F185|nr:GGDEF domain-containing protein [Salinibius halmophilus]
MTDSLASETLQRFVQRISLLSYGRSAALDTAISALKDAIKADAPMAELDAKLKVAEEAADDTERQEKRARWQLNSQVLEFAQTMDLSQLKQIDLESQDSSLLKQFEIVAAALQHATRNMTRGMPMDVHNRIQDLLHCLRAYGRETIRCQELLEQLNQQPQTWQAILDEAVAMAIQLLRAEQAEFEQYLATLNQQLSEIRQVVSATQSQDEAFSAMEDRFTARIDEHFQRIEDQLAKNLNIDELKVEIVNNLQGIRADMGEFLAQQREIRKTLRDQMVDLGRTVSSMAEENRRQQRELVATKKSAMTDALTGMPNRSAYEETWPSFVANASNDGLVLVVADIDKFKGINDQFGHQAGDRLLQVVAKLLSDGIRKSDFVCRYGGEEFVILMSGITLEQSQTVINKLRERIQSARLTYKGERVTVTCSFGVAKWTQGSEFNDVFNQADEALYKAKRSGRNQVVLAEPSD